MTVLMATLAFAVSPGLGPVAASHPGTPGYTDLDAMSVGQEGPKGALWFLVDTKGAIPRFPDAYVNSAGAFGYVWLIRTEAVGHPELVGFRVAFLVEIHPFRPFAWHLHPLALGGSRSSDTICSAGTTGILLLHEAGPFRVPGDESDPYCLANGLDGSSYESTFETGGIVIVGDIIRIMRPGGAPLSDLLNPCNEYGTCYTYSYAVASFRRL